ncbi:MAG: PilZ domain-containing protein [Clostridia bacterium]|nr:PilZ domain-containing protein [Clostridia bacterium]
MICKETNVQLEKLLSKGSVVYVKHSGMYEPSLSVVQKINEREMHISIPEALIESNVLVGDCLSCQQIDGEFEYVFQGIVNDIEIKQPGSICVFIEKVSKFKNNRLFKRYSVNFQADILMAGSDESIYSIVKNISIIGAGVISKQHLYKDTIITLKIATFISCDEMLEFKAKIVRIIKNENFYEYGIEIIDIDSKNKDILDKVIFCLNTNENIFIEDLL